MHENDIGTLIVDSAVHLHRDLGWAAGDGLRSDTRRDAAESRTVRSASGSVSIEYRGQRFDEGFRADLIVEGKVIVELKSVETVHPAHKKQVLTYLRLTGLKLGYLLNFGEALMKSGITRIVHGEL
ncbi:MAG: GxxExxY protein [Planctomycetaceae bacterium]